METSQYEPIGSLMLAEENGKRFVESEESFEIKNKTQKNRISKLGGLNPFWIVMSLIGISLAIVFGVYEAYMAESAIISFIDPLGTGKVNQNLVRMIGAGLAIFAMFMGHIFSEGLQSDKHPVTGKLNRKLGIPFYISCVGLVGYIYFQYLLVVTAGEGVLEFNHFAMIAIGVAVLEIFVGVLILGKAYTYLLIFISSIRIWILRQIMNRSSRSVKNNYRNYSLLLDNWNMVNPSRKMLKETNISIQRAMNYYDGTIISHSQKNKNSNKEPINGSTKSSSKNGQTDGMEINT